MINKTTFLATFLLITSSLHSMSEMTEGDILKKALSKLSKKQLHTAAREAVRNKKPLSTELLLEAGAKPPLFTAAKHGNRRCAAKVAKKAAREGLKITPQKRINILNRLILTGDLTNLDAYFSNKIVTAADITLVSILYARRRADINPNNKRILRFLKKHEKAASSQAKQKAEIKFDQTTCTICLDDFKKGGIKTLPCSHVFHPDCCKPWFKSRGFEQCPICKQSENKHLAEDTPPEWLQWLHG